MQIIGPMDHNSFFKTYILSRKTVVGDLLANDYCVKAALKTLLKYTNFSHDRT